jgi:hypothetical protein
MDIIEAGADITDLVSGAVRVLAAPITESVPDGIEDVMLMESPYTLQGDWFDLGATTGPTTTSRGIESQGLSIEQRQGNVIEDVTDVSRGISLPLAGISPENLQIFENASAIGTIAAASGVSAQKVIKFGSFSEATEYRVMLIGKRPKKAGLVNESGSEVRGRLVARALYRVSLTADESSLSFGKGSLASADVSFKAFPEPGEDADEAHGAWFLEDAGTIA